MKALNRKLTIFFLITLVVLLFIELGSNYDVLNRRIALIITDILSVLGFIAVYSILKKKYQIILPWITALAMALGVWMDALGNFLHFYTKYGWWDDIAHFSGTLASAVIMLVIINSLNEKGIISLGSFAQGFFAFGVTMLLASFYEITELWGDLLFSMHRIGDRFDTATDLNWDFFGALLAVLIGTRILKRIKKFKKLKT